MCDCGCDNGCANGCGQPTKIITKEGIQGPAGATGATGATGAAGADGTDGLGYDNMVSTSSINITAPVPFSSSNTITADKAPTVGTRLRYTSQSDLTQWVEGVVTSYVTATGATNIDFDLKSSTGTGVHNDWAVTVIGEPGSGSGFGDIVNIGSGAEIYKGLNGTDAEVRSLIGSGALSGGVTQATNEIYFNPITCDTQPSSGSWPDTNGNCTIVYAGGIGTAPSFSYTPVGSEVLSNPGSLSTASTVLYYDYNDHIYLVFEVIISNFLLSPIGSSKWSAVAPTFSINGLPVNNASGNISENLQVHMSIEPTAKFALTDAKDDYMYYMKSVPLVYSSGTLATKNPGGYSDDFFCLPATKSYAVDLRFNGRLLLNKN